MRAPPKSQADYYKDAPLEGKGYVENGLAHDVCLGRGDAKRCRMSPSLFSVRENGHVPVTDERQGGSCLQERS